LKLLLMPASSWQSLVLAKLLCKKSCALLALVPALGPLVVAKFAVAVTPHQR
jgi:hypothetical protein